MIALGTPVTYHHRAAVARFTNMGEKYRERCWVLFEGVDKNEYSPGLTGGPIRDLFHDQPPIKSRRMEVNKTVMVWPEEGSGVITGRVRRQRGESTRARRGSGSFFDDDYEPGYFQPTDTFTLYAVRHALDGTGYILVPEWALAPMTS